MDQTLITRRKHGGLLDLRKIIGDKKFIVVGDIHGCFDEFLELLQKCKYFIGNFVISVGDLMDRGPDSRSVIQWFRKTKNAYVVEGNHDNKARRYWAGNRVKIAHGLDKTIEQCKDMNTTAIAQWIESWPQIIRLPDINGKPTYVVHAGVDGTIPIDRQPIENCLYARYFGGQGFLDPSGDIWYSTLDGSYNIISGHMIHDNPIPTDCGPMDFVYLLDGGAYQGGELRALVVENGKTKIESVQSKRYDEVKTPINEVASRDELVDQQLLRCSDKGDLRVYTYTDNCTHSASWNEVTMNSRGIIINRVTGEIVARPFSKFFNVGEREETMEHNLPWTSNYLVFEKMDGWLGTLYRFNGEYCIATRGSFDGMGIGVWATNHLRTHYDLSDLPDEVTLVFEIICPQTKIIVDYKSREDLVLLAAFNRHTGEEYEWNQVTQWATQFGFSVPRVFGSDISECRRILSTYAGNEMEGFVIRFADGLRVKIKSEDYRRRAALMMDLTPLSIWKVLHREATTKKEYDCLFSSLDEMRQTVDDDYVEMFNEICETIRAAYRKVWDQIWDEFDKVKHLQDRKEFAFAVKGSLFRGAMFSMLDKKWHMIDKMVLEYIRPDDNVYVEV